MVEKRGKSLSHSLNMNEISDVGSVSVKRCREIIYMYWKIDGFIFRIHDPNDEWCSPMLKELNETWQFVILPNSKYISLHIKCRGATNPVEGTVYSVGIQNGDGTIHTYSEPRTVSESLIFGEEYLIQRSALLSQRNAIAPEGHVTFFMTICLKNSKSQNNSIGDSVNMTSIPEDIYQGLITLSSDLKEFFTKRNECDVVFKVNDKEYPAHKSIIAARSPVFECMFKHDMEEKKSGVINIVDSTPEAFHVLLIYLYSGQVDEFSSDTVVDLYNAASKYELEDLRTKCRNFAMKNLSIETFCAFMLLGLLHKDPELIKCATDYFIVHAKKLMLTVQWQEFLKENPTSANELYIKALNTTET